MKTIKLNKLLSCVRIEASAPGRVDCGGTWDIKALALCKERQKPVTVNIALDLRTTVVLFPYDPKKNCVDSDSFEKEEYFAELQRFDTPLGLVFAIISFFNVSGVRISIISEIPSRSGLGGSSVIAVAVIGALSKALKLAGHPISISKRKIAILAHNIESGTLTSNTGLQDQLAASFGGVNLWTWRYSDISVPYIRQVLLNRKEYKEFQKHILIAYTGEDRSSTDITSQYIKSFLAGKDHEKWLEIRQLTEKFSTAIRNQSWTAASNILKNESQLREKILHRDYSEITKALREAVSHHGCGSGFTGGNHSGCIWAIGDKASIAKLSDTWKTTLKMSEYGKILSNKISEQGLIIKCLSRHGGRIKRNNVIHC